jgi:hypothetical protein
MSITKNILKFTAGLAVTATSILAIAGPANAAVVYYVSPFATNNVMAVTGAGQAAITANNTTLTVSTYLRDKNDGYYATLQVRPLVRFNSTGLSQWSTWRNVGTTGVEAAPGTYMSRPFFAASGTIFTDAEIRICQTNAAGTILGRCTVTVGVDNWLTYYA